MDRAARGRETTLSIAAETGRGKVSGKDEKLENVTIRRGLTSHEIRAGWAVNATTRRERSTRTVYDPVNVHETVTHHRDTYTTYGDDPSTPDYLRSHETTTRVDRQSWSETVTRTDSVARSEAFEEDVTRHDIVMDDGTIHHGVRGMRSGDRVYFVHSRRFGRDFAPEWYSATARKWEPQLRTRYTYDLARRAKTRPYAMPTQFAAMRRATMPAIQDDMTALLATMENVDPSGIDLEMWGLRYVDGVVGVKGDQVTMRYAGMSVSGPQRPECTFRDGDMMMAIIPPGPNPGTGLAALFNPRTGATWINERTVGRPGMIKRLHGARWAVAAIAGAVLSAAVGHEMGEMRIGAIAALGLVALAAILWGRSGNEHRVRSHQADQRRRNLDVMLDVMRGRVWNHLATRAMNRKMGRR